MMKMDIEKALETLGLDAVAEEDVYEPTGMSVIILNKNHYWLFNKHDIEVSKNELSNEEYEYAEEVWDL